MIGFLNVNKPSGMTSNFVVQKLKRKFKPSKIGHFGTLDPMASGVLPIAIGKATRLFDYSLNKKKGYIATFDFGYLTDTLDITGSITNEGGKVPTREDIISILDSMVGRQDQIPPIYSAKNIDGRRAYDLAREGIEFELKPKEITVYKLELLEQVSDTKFKFNIECSSGTYIRAIGRDMASRLGTMATMSELIRTKAGDFDLSSAIDLDTLLSADNILDYLISPLDAFKKLGKINIDKDIYNKLKNGIEVKYLGEYDDSFVYHEDKLMGIVKKNKDRLKLDIYLEE